MLGCSCAVIWDKDPFVYEPIDRSVKNYGNF